MRFSRGIIQLRYSSFVCALIVSSLVVHLLTHVFWPALSPFFYTTTSLPSGRTSENPYFQLCTGSNVTQCIMPLKHFDTKVRTAESYNLAACVIEKSMSTVLAAIICFLHDEEAFTSANRTITTDIWETRFCKNKNEPKSLKMMAAQSSKAIEDWLLFTIVRDPIDRFLSGFVDKCIMETKRNWDPSKCYGCDRNMTCFIQEQYKRAKDLSNGKARGWSYEDIHFFPQNWHCEFNNHMSKYNVIRYVPKSSDAYDNFLDALKNVFYIGQVPEDTIQKIMEELKVRQKSRHTTALSPERVFYAQELYSKPEVMDLVVKLYFYDFIMFGFDLPTPLDNKNRR